MDIKNIKKTRNINVIILMNIIQEWLKKINKLKKLLRYIRQNNKDKMIRIIKIYNNNI
jgi:hypothetical protein